MNLHFKEGIKRVFTKTEFALHDIFHSKAYVFDWITANG